MRLLPYVCLLSLGMLTWPAVAFAQMQGPPPAPPQPTPQAAAAERKTPAKRGTHWYRHPARQTPLEQAAYAYGLLQAERLRAAQNAYQALVYAWPDSPQAAPAQLALAQVLQKRELYERAFDEYQYLIDHYAGQFNYTDVLQAQFQIANYLMTTKRGRFFFFPGFAAPERALPLFEKIIQNAPSWEKASLAQFTIGTIHELNDNDEEALAAYEVLMSRYPDSEWASSASYRAADCLRRLSQDRPQDENALNSARAALIDFIRSYPNDDRVPDARARLKALNVRKEAMALERARFYDRLRGHPEAALRAYEDFLRNFPSSDSAPLVTERIAALKALTTGTRQP